MLEIVAVLLVAISVLLAKHGRSGRARYSLRPVRVHPELALSTLATDTVISTNVTAPQATSLRVISTKFTWALSGLTAGEGPITCGLSHSDYTVTEIKEFLDSGGSIDPGDKIANERANRLVRVVGTFKSEANTYLNDGRPIKTRLNWAIAIGESLEVWFFNEQTGTLTTGAVGRIQGTMWVKDSV